MKIHCESWSRFNLFESFCVSGELVRGDAGGKRRAEPRSKPSLHRCVPASYNVTNLSSRILSCLTQSVRLLFFQPRNLIMLIIGALCSGSDCSRWFCCATRDFHYLRAQLRRKQWSNFQTAQTPPGRLHSISATCTNLSSFFLPPVIRL